jgi:hypothetical protein
MNLLQQFLIKMDIKKKIITRNLQNGIAPFVLLKKIKNYVAQLVKIFNPHICIDKYN